MSTTGKDMILADAVAAVERVFDSPAPSLAIEFQGGEPTLRFDLVREMVLVAAARNLEAGR